ncbi:efflux RND transporter permease subunit [Caenispirillum salinarum]|uniref:efflux RND transporter permease subunit n=1 Tax=Caenispirillum salinarum TaxID=859058 RepID=UPI00385007FB
MDIARASIEKPVNTWLIILICLIGGIWGLLTLGRLEDPEFTIKEAVITTPYPGASAVEVEQEVTDQLETAIQRLPQVKEVRSRSTPGMSQITVEMRSEYDSETLPQIWDELRRKVNDMQGDLPPGAKPSTVNDDFGDVFGLFYALTAPDYTQGDLRDFARTLRQELLQVPGVAKVSLDGLREERIFVEIPQSVITQLGIPPTTIGDALSVQNAVVDSGAMRVDDQYVRLSPSGGFTSVERIQNLFLSAGPAGGGNTIRLGDIADITRGYKDVPDKLIRHDGVPAATIGVSAQSGTNIVEVGEAVEARLAEVMRTLPVGVQMQPIYEQHKVVDRAVSGFIVNLASSVAIVILVLCLAMGWRGGVVVGGVLLLTVLGTLLMMKVFGITMQRISLGALIIAMGMLVDNAIVIAEGMMVRMKRGVSAKAAASEIAGQTQIPLLAATVIGILAFSGIGLSDDATGEFTFSLFAVIGISLLLSWILAVTVTPLLASYLFKTRSAEAAAEAGEPVLLRGYRRSVEAALRHRLMTILALVGLTVAAVAGFGFVKQSFFPDSATPIFYIDYWRQQGTDIRATAEDMAEIEDHLRGMEGVTNVSTFIGGGADRMMLVYASERPNDSYGQFVVRAEDADRIPAIGAAALQWLSETYPEAEAKMERVQLGPGGGAKIEARFSGADPAVLRRLSLQAQELFREAGLINVRHDWRQREKLIVPRMAEDRATGVGVTRRDIADALAVATEGRQVGLYREGDRLIPIVMRAPEGERGANADLRDRRVWAPASRSYVPMSEVVDSFDTADENGIIRRLDKQRTITAQADPPYGGNAAAAFQNVRPLVEAIDLPEGYRLEWGGEHENSSEAQASLAAGLPLGFLAMVLITIALFGKVRQPLIIWLCVPMAICGVTIALLTTGLPFGFMALLGMLSLSGMLIKNAIVLVDEIDLRISGGHHRHAAIVDASVSRFSPVLLAAVTTILGMVPLLFDVFFASMAATIMGGLAFATVLTLIAVPVFYALFFRVREDEDDQEDAAEATAPAAGGI